MLLLHGEAEMSIDTLSTWEFPDCEWIPDGYDMTQVPKVSDRNFNILLGHHNKLVDEFNALLDKLARLQG